MRRPDWQHGPACEGRGAADSRSAGGGRGERDREPRERRRPRVGGSVLSSLADRVRGILAPSAAPLPANRESGIANPAALSELGGEWRGNVFVVERRFAPAARHGREPI